MSKRSAIIIGGGIVGLAHARALAMKGYSVQVFERNELAVGASIRNFGMVWPIGQPDGVLFDRAMRSRNIWKALCEQTGLWYSEVGSLHIATNALEEEAMVQIADVYKKDRSTQWLGVKETLEISPGVNQQNLRGALWSPTELIVESRIAIQQLPQLLQEQFGVEFHFNCCISRVEKNTVWSGNRTWKADVIMICSGADFETLFPAIFSSFAITKCKLQMLRLTAQPEGWKLGPSICGGLSLIHYKSFEIAAALPLLKEYYAENFQDYLKWGIHVMACQNKAGEITVGDTHEYGLHQDPFDKSFLNQLVLDYLQRFARFKSVDVMQTWNGIYAKMQNGQTELVHKVDDDIWIVNGLGGAGMTLSFGLAEEVVVNI